LKQREDRAPELRETLGKEDSEGSKRPSKKIKFQVVNRKEGRFPDLVLDRKEKKGRRDHWGVASGSSVGSTWGGRVENSR